MRIHVTAAVYDNIQNNKTEEEEEEKEEEEEEIFYCQPYNRNRLSVRY